MEVEDGREISVAATAGGGRGEAPLDSNEIGLSYFSRLFLECGAETERRCSTGDALHSNGASVMDNCVCEHLPQRGTRCDGSEKGEQTFSEVFYSKEKHVYR